MYGRECVCVCVRCLSFSSAVALWSPENVMCACERESWLPWCWGWERRTALLYTQPRLLPFLIPGSPSPFTLLLLLLYLSLPLSLPLSCAFFSLSQSFSPLRSPLALLLVKMFIGASHTFTVTALHLHLLQKVISPVLFFIFNDRFYTNWSLSNWDGKLNIFLECFHISWNAGVEKAAVSNNQSELWRTGIGPFNWWCEVDRGWTVKSAAHRLTRWRTLQQEPAAVSLCCDEKSSAGASDQSSYCTMKMWLMKSARDGPSSRFSQIHQLCSDWDQQPKTHHCFIADGWIFSNSFVVLSCVHALSSQVGTPPFPVPGSSVRSTQPLKTMVWTFLVFLKNLQHL